MSAWPRTARQRAAVGVDGGGVAARRMACARPPSVLLDTRDALFGGQRPECRSTTARVLHRLRLTRLAAAGSRTPRETADARAAATPGVLRRRSKRGCRPTISRSGNVNRFGTATRACCRAVTVSQAASSAWTSAPSCTAARASTRAESPARAAPRTGTSASPTCPRALARRCSCKPEAQQLDRATVGRLVRRRPRDPGTDAPAGRGDTADRTRCAHCRPGTSCSLRRTAAPAARRRASTRASESAPRSRG